MPRNISCALTIPQIEAETKTETRRLGWDFLKEGDVLNVVDRTMGFKKGESPRHIRKIYVEKTWREPLNNITREGVYAEGFPEMSVKEFIEFFCDSHNCESDTNIRVIQFDYVPF